MFLLQENEILSEGLFDFMKVKPLPEKADKKRLKKDPPDDWKDFGNLAAKIKEFDAIAEKKGLKPLKDFDELAGKFTKRQYQILEDEPVVTTYSDGVALYIQEHKFANDFGRRVMYVEKSRDTHLPRRDRFFKKEKMCIFYCNDEGKKVKQVNVVSMGV